jgi:hypothetical protein
MSGCLTSKCRAASKKNGSHFAGDANGNAISKSIGINNIAALRTNTQRDTVGLFNDIFYFPYLCQRETSLDYTLHALDVTPRNTPR